MRVRTANGTLASRRRYDVIVVGAGIAGSLLAKQLGLRGWRVLVLEAGTGGRETWEGYLDAVETFRSAVAKVPNSAFRRNVAASSPDVLDLAPDGVGFTANGYFVQNGELPYGTDYLRAVGGSGMHWLGICLRMHPDDFAVKTRYGYGRDWPIGYGDLEPYYAAAEREIGVAGDAQEQRALGIPSEEDYVYPMQKIPPSYIDEVCRSLDGRMVHDPVAVEDFTLRVVSVPQGRNSTPDPRYARGSGYLPKGAVGLPNYGERCVGNASCVPLCPVQAKWTPLRTQAEFTESVTLSPRCVVTRVIDGNDGRIRGVEYRRYDDPASAASRPCRAEADVVVVAAHAIENARLLLASGLAGGSGELGRNLMDHPTLLSWALAPAAGGQIGPFRGPGSTSGWEAFRFGDARRRRAPFRIEIGNWGWGWAAGAPMSNVGTALGVGGDRQGSIVPAAVFGTMLRHALGDQIGRQLQLQLAVEQPADRDNRVTIDDRYRDAMGNHRPVLTYNLSDHVKEGLAAAKRVASAVYAELGAQEHTDHSPRDGVAPLGYFRYRDHDYAYKGAGHGAGTHIMGSDAKSSVVDSFQRCWDHPNLYAVGCGSMPSIGTSNPSLTMAALALRSAEQIHRDLIERHRPVSLGTAGARP
ncbi:MAG: GMC family oxidoreductase [Pseudonocardiales bacterium]|nr:GMC family oxidoreductase [Pseudonocardiales bacterium]MBV9028728.1 GMC family oxidoreductase [Pseudonocardiales bacterium]MBW0011036.1 GMC family oxidoreductase [Pseudonocardiales bacterium]